MTEYGYSCACCGKYWRATSTGRKPAKAEIARMVCQPCRDTSKRIAALEAELANLQRYKEAIEWCEAYWPDVEFAAKHCEIARLEPGQGEHRLFRGGSFLEAVERAMAVPPFTGESVPERRSRIAALEAEVAALREDKARLVDALKEERDDEEKGN